MCSWCGDDQDAVRNRKDALRFAETLERLAQNYRDFGYKRSNPHAISDVIVSRAKAAIRQLVDDWL